MDRLLTLGLSLLAAALPLSADAMGPADPFTPPAPAARAVDTSASSAAPIRGLTGVRLGNSPGALIDGQWVALGQPVRESRLAAVRASGVLLRHADGHTEPLALFPDVAAPSNTPIAMKRDLP